MAKSYTATISDGVAMGVDITPALPWDSRDVTDTIADLISKSTWARTLAYAGMKVVIKGTPYIYVLKALPSTNADNWERQVTYSEFSELELRLLAVELELKMDTESLTIVLAGTEEGVTDEVTTDIDTLASDFLGY